VSAVYSPSFSFSLFVSYDLTDDAHGLVQRVSKIRTVYRDGLPVDLVGPTSKVPIEEGGEERENE